MNETTFENAKVGDKVWSSHYGWGTVEENRTFGSCGSTITVRFLTDSIYAIKGGIFHAFPYNGNNEFGIRTLFWDEVKFEAPPRPKRMEKKVVEGYSNLKRIGGIVESGPLWDSSDDALKGRSCIYKYLGEPFFIHHEYEVEECSELIQALCKAERFGWANCHPDRPDTTNMDDVRRELSDVINTCVELEKKLLDIIHGG